MDNKKIENKKLSDEKEYQEALKKVTDRIQELLDFKTKVVISGLAAGHTLEEIELDLPPEMRGLPTEIADRLLPENLRRKK